MSGGTTRPSCTCMSPHQILQSRLRWFITSVAAVFGMDNESSGIKNKPLFPTPLSSPSLMEEFLEAKRTNLDESVTVKKPSIAVSSPKCFADVFGRA
jgi:hypothetical protein